jgi:hypothetical protein
MYRKNQEKGGPEGTRLSHGLWLFVKAHYLGEGVGL